MFIQPPLFSQQFEQMHGNFNKGPKKGLTGDGYLFNMRLSTGPDVKLVPGLERVRFIG